MLDFKKKRTARKIIRSRIVMGILLLAVVFLGNATWNAHQGYKKAKEKEEHAARQLTELTKRKEGIEKDLNRLQTAQGVEAELRQRYNVGKEGEEVIVVVSEDEGQEEQKDDNRSFIAALWQAVVSVFSFK